MRPARLFASLVLIAACSAQASVILDTLGPSNAFNPAGGATVSFFQNVGVRFIPDSSVSPTDIAVAMRTTSDAIITLSICADSANHPGAVLSSTTVVVEAGDPQVYPATFDTPAALSAGTTYWIKAYPSNGTATWMPNSIGVTGYSFTLSSGAWNSNTNGATPAVRLEDNSSPPLMGACCAGSTCVVSLPTTCNALNTRFVGSGTSCNALGNTTTPCCQADFNQSGTVTVQDIFDYLNAWFNGGGQADINGGGLAVADIFDFLGAWFSGC